MGFLLLKSKSYLVCGSLSMGFDFIQLGFCLLVKVEILVLLGEGTCRIYISVLLYSKKVLIMF